MCQQKQDNPSLVTTLKSQKFLIGTMQYIEQQDMRVKIAKSVMDVFNRIYKKRDNKKNKQIFLIKKREPHS